MRHLYLMRHAKAKQGSGDGDMTDHQRPLRKRGRHQAAAMAQALQRWQALEGDIYVSGAALPPGPASMAAGPPAGAA